MAGGDGVFEGYADAVRLCGVGEVVEGAREAVGDACPDVVGEGGPCLEDVLDCFGERGGFGGVAGLVVVGGGHFVVSGVVSVMAACRSRASVGNSSGPPSSGISIDFARS